MNPTDRKYSKEHEWAKVESDGGVVVGITHYAQDQLGDVVYLDLPTPGTELEQYNKLGEIESVKAVSDVYSPIGGTVITVNTLLIDSPNLVNEDPFGEGWLVRIKPKDIDQEMANLLTMEAYQDFLDTEAH